MHEELEVYRGRHVKFRCSKCRRILFELVADPDPLCDEVWPLRSRKTHGWNPMAVGEQVTGAPLPPLSRGAVTTRSAGDGREIWTCHRRCGQRYTLKRATVTAHFLAAVRAGLDEHYLGEK